jgi:hypothetical protein
MKTWHPSQNTLLNIQRKENDLIKNFEWYLRRFTRKYERGRTFDGPSLYFHFRAIKISSNMSVEEKLQDERFLEYVYATLASWGMHRMGDTKTKITNFGKLKSEVTNHRNNILELENIKIWEIDNIFLQDIFPLLRSVLNQMKISISKAPLVSNTKILHHILPNLIIPIDRNYTLKYFGINTQAPSQYYASDIFKYLYPHLIKVAQSKQDFIIDKINLDEENWNTSFTKIIDNAIIGSLI